MLFRILVAAHAWLASVVVLSSWKSASHSYDKCKYFCLLGFTSIAAKFHFQSESVCQSSVTYNKYATKKWLLLWSPATPSKGACVCNRCAINLSGSWCLYNCNDRSIIFCTLWPFQSPHAHHAHMNARRYSVAHSNPLAIVVDEFAFVGSEGCLAFGDPIYCMQNETVARLAATYCSVARVIPVRLFYPPRSVTFRFPACQCCHWTRMLRSALIDL